MKRIIALIVIAAACGIACAVVLSTWFGTAPVGVDVSRIQSFTDPSLISASLGRLITVCDPLKQVASADKLLDDLSPRVGTSPVSFMEQRVHGLRTLTDYERDIPLAVLNTDTCAIQIVTVHEGFTQTVVGGQSTTAVTFTAPQGWSLSIHPRESGIRFNYWATEFIVDAPVNNVVIRLRWGRVADVVLKGQSRVTYVNYSPYSEALGTPEVVRAGFQHVVANAVTAYGELEATKVPSHAFPDLRFVDLPEHTKNILLQVAEEVPPDEHMDPDEFLTLPSWPFTRVMTLLAYNGDTFASMTCSSAGACGQHQFTEGTYQTIRTKYPLANLMADFQKGSSDANNSTKATILLTDNNLAALINALGPDIVDDPRIVEYLLAAHNTGVARVANVVGIAKQNNIAEWTDARGKDCSPNTKPTYRQCLLVETKAYIAKGRFITDRFAELAATVALQR